MGKTETAFSVQRAAYTIIIMAVIAAVVWGQDQCVRPGILNPADVPFAYDSDGHEPIAWMGIEATRSYSSEVRGCDPDGDPFIMEPVFMPEGSTWNAATNTWSWTPTIEQVGVHFIKIRATDIVDPNTRWSKSSESEFMICVKAFNETPVILPDMDPFVK